MNLPEANWSYSPRSPSLSPSRSNLLAGIPRSYHKIAELMAN
jgi:hypothetical protein